MGSLNTGRYDLAAMGYHSKTHVHLLTEAEKIVYRLRAVFLGDSDFFPAPWRELTEMSYVDRLAGLIDSVHALMPKAWVELAFCLNGFWRSSSF